MTVPAIEPVVNHHGDGENTTFDFDFFIENQSQLAVYKINASGVEILMTNEVDYHIEGINNENGGTVTFPLLTSSYRNLQTDEVLSLRLTLPVSQESEYGASSKLQLPAFEYSYDYLTRLIQILKRQIDRSVKTIEGSGVNPDELINEILATADITKINSDSAKNSAQSAFEKLQSAIALLQSTQNEFDKIKNAQLDKIFITTRPLFEVIELDRELSDVEKPGYGEQGEEYSYADYPDAYSLLASGFITGEKYVYKSDEQQTLYKQYTLSNEDVVYTPYSEEIEAGQKLYSDTALTTEYGEIASVENVTVNSYAGSSYNFYLPFGSEITTGITAYSDEALLTSLGTVNDLKDVQGKKYTASTSGNFYIPTDEIPRKTLTIYSDEALTTEKGTITDKKTITSDKYMIGENERYVEENSTLAVGTVLYSDCARLTSVGTVTEKGTISKDGSYYYMIGNGGVNAYNEPMQFYTKTEINGTYQASYYDKACTISTGHPVLRSGNNLYYYTSASSSYGNVRVYNNWRLVEQYDIVTENYVCIDYSTTKLSYEKQETGSVETIKIGTGNFETFELKEVYQKNFIKIGLNDYQSYVIDGINESMTITLTDDNVLKITFDGVQVSSGITFEYVLTDDGQRIVDNKYIDAISSYITANTLSPYYIINTKDKEFTLPLKATGKYVYFGIGNTALRSAIIDNLVVSDDGSVYAAKLAELYGAVTAAANQVTYVTEAKDSALTAIGSDNTSGKRGEAITAITNAQTSAVSNVNTAKTNALTAIGTTDSTGARGEAITAISGYVTTCSNAATACTNAENYLKEVDFSKCSLTGNIENDASIYARLYTMYHSSFDKSKFDITGTPIITDEGIIISTANTEYVSFTETSDNSSSYRIEMEFKLIPASWTSGGYVFNNDAMKLYIGSNGYIRFNFCKSDSITVEPSNFIGTINTTYNVFMEINYSTLKVTTGYKQDTDTTYTTTTATTDSLHDFSVTKLFMTVAKITGDLRKVTLYKNGYPVFSGNKTGINTIKPNDYMVVGTPIITDDGIVSGFATNDTIKTINPNALVTDAQIYIKCRTGSDVNTVQSIIGQATTNKATPRIELQNTKLKLLWSQNGSSWDSTIETDYTIAENTDYWLLIDIHNEIINFAYSLNGKNYTSLGTRTASTGLWIKDILQLGKASNYVFLGSIDLNEFKIYINGNLVYQPCLKIPYTEASTGDLICDAIYRSRIQDMYEQKGYAPFYSIDEANKTYTNPRGALIGYMNKLIENSIGDVNTALSMILGE